MNRSQKLSGAGWYAFNLKGKEVSSTDETAFRAAYDAFEAWRIAKLKSDRTLAFADCHDTAQAWVRFQNLYLGDGQKLPTRPASRNVVELPWPPRTLGGAA